MYDEAQVKRHSQYSKSELNGLRFMSELTDSVIFVKPYGFKNAVSSLVIKKV